MDHVNYYATAFDTVDSAVKYWHDLTERQQFQAMVMFAGLGTLDMHQHVYNVGLTGGIICRRPLHHSDPARRRDE